MSEHRPAVNDQGHRLAAAHSSSADKAASRSTSTSPTSDCSRRTRPASTACRRSGWMAMSMQLHYLRLLLSCLEFRRATGYQWPHRTPRAFLSTCSGRCLPKRPNDSKQGLCSYGRTFVQKLDAGSVPCSAFKGQMAETVDFGPKPGTSVRTTKGNRIVLCPVPGQVHAIAARAKAA